MPNGTKLADGTYSYHHMLCVTQCPFIGPLPDAGMFQFTVTDGGDTLTDRFDVEWLWNENHHRYEKASGGRWTFWGVFENGGGFVQEHGGTWDTQYHGEYQKSP